jgi:predicted permease
VVRQLLTESVVLALLGAAAAVAVSWWGSRTMFAMVAEGDSAARLDLAPDARSFAFTAAVALLTAILFGLAPALRATRLDLNASLKEGGPSTGAGARFGRVLVAAQVALSVVLLIGTGLFTRTLYKMKAQDLGYTRENIIVMRVDPISAGYKGDDIGRICMTLLERIRGLPGVRGATFSENGLFSGTESGAPVTIDGYTPATARDRSVRFDQVGPGYFTNVGIPILLGRDISDADHETAPRVVVINDIMARFYFGDQNPLGRLVRCDGTDKFTLTIVGVAGNARDHGLRAEIYRRMYVPFRQPIDGLTGAKFEVRTAIDPAVMAAELRAASTEVAPKMPVESVKPLLTLIDESLLRERMIAKLSVLFGIVAVVLAAIGLYGMLAYSVARRTSEIGVRLAIGARPSNIVWMIVCETAGLVAAGIAVGVPTAIGLSRYVETLLFGLRPNDLATIAAVVALIAATALVAAIGPARRASGIDPLRALRYE